MFPFEEGTETEREIDGIRSVDEYDKKLRDVSGHVIPLGQGNQGARDGADA